MGVMNFNPVTCNNSTQGHNIQDHTQNKDNITISSAILKNGI